VRPGSSRQKAIEAAPKPDTRLSEAAARAALAAYRPLPEVFAFLERAKAGGDKDGIFLRAYGEICLSLGRYGEAEDVLKKTVAMAPNVVKTRLLYARALKHLGRIDEACDQMSIIVDQEPSPANKRLAVGTLLRAGRDEEAGRLYHAMVDERKAKLQGSFGEVVQAIDARIDTVKIPQGRLDWAWDLATRTLGSAPSDDRAEWDRRAKWGHLLDTAIIDWLECSTERAGEVRRDIQHRTDEARIVPLRRHRARARASSWPALTSVRCSPARLPSMGWEDHTDGCRPPRAWRRRNFPTPLSPQPTSRKHRSHGTFSRLSKKDA